MKRVYGIDYVKGDFRYMLWLLRKQTDRDLRRLIITAYINGYEDLTRYFVDQVRARRGGVNLTDSEWAAYKDFSKMRWESYRNDPFPSLDNPF